MNVVPFAIDRTDVVCLELQFALLEALDLTGDGVAVVEDNDIGSLCAGWVGDEKEYTGKENAELVSNNH